MAWNYPPGVTGGEFAIAGSDEDWEEERFCPACGAETTWICSAYQHDAWGNCVKCDYYEEISLS